MPADDCLWVKGCYVEQIIDGYFPLHTSLRHLLERNGFSAAVVSLSYAPIMHIPQLSPVEPVPLTVRTEQVGLIEHLSLCVTPRQLSGFGRWRWFSRGDKSGDQFDPMTRLAEPAFIEGLGLAAGDEDTEHLGKLRRSDAREIGLHSGCFPVSDHRERSWGPFGSARAIQLRSDDRGFHGTRGAPIATDTGVFVSYRADDLQHRLANRSG